MGIKLSLNVTYCLVLLYQFVFVHFPMRGSRVSTCSSELNREKTSDVPLQSSETVLEDGASSYYGREHRKNILNGTRSE